MDLEITNVCVCVCSVAVVGAETEVSSPGRQTKPGSHPGGLHVSVCVLSVCNSKSSWYTSKGGSFTTLSLLLANKSWPISPIKVVLELMLLPIHHLVTRLRPKNEMES